MATLSNSSIEAAGSCPSAIIWSVTLKSRGCGVTSVKIAKVTRIHRRTGTLRKIST